MTPLIIFPLPPRWARYDKWECIVEGRRYAIVRNNGDWALLRRDAGQWEPIDASVEVFLEDHNLQLAEPSAVRKGDMRP